MLFLAVMTSLDVLDGTVDTEGLLTWINGEIEGRGAGGWGSAQSGCGKAVVSAWGDVRAFSEVAGAVEVPQENQDGSKVKEEYLKSDVPQDELLGELDSQEREELVAWINAATQPQSPDVPSSGTPTDPFSELLPCRPLLLPAVAPPELPLPTTLAAPAPPSLHRAQLMEEAQWKQPRVVLSRLALPPGCVSCRVVDEHHQDSTKPAKRPVPPLPQTSQLMEEVRQKQPRVVVTRLALPPGFVSCRVADTHHFTAPAGSIPANNGKLQPRRKVKRRKHRRSATPALDSTVAGSSKGVGSGNDPGSLTAPAAPRHEGLCSRGTITGPIRPPPQMSGPPKSSLEWDVVGL